MPDFLLELGLEEIPARMIAGAEAELGRRVSELFKRERLVAQELKFTTSSTPRRLAVLVEGVFAKQADTEEQMTGPSWKVAFKDGAPTAAAEAFAKKAGIAVSALEKVTTPKGEYVGAKVNRPGRTTADILAAELSKEVLEIYWAKNMYWRAGKPERFVRPVRWVVALLDSEVVPLEIAGIAAGNASRGHRILHGDAPVAIDLPENYSEKLRAAGVVVSAAERRHIIRKALDAATRTIPGARWREDEPLIETVTNLTEWPSVLLGSFEPDYLSLPEEVLVTVMRDHQKYFAIEDANGKLAPHFLAVLNTEVDDEGRDLIRHGNERVLRSRFKDARFFWDFDQKVPLADRVESLKSVTFHKDLSSYLDKTLRLKTFVNRAVRELEERGVYGDWEAAVSAAHVAKTDLTCELVKEFTELQGVIGGLYARAQGLDGKVAQAVYDQYTPAAIEDPIPLTLEGQLLSIADRADSVAGMFGIGAQPTGSRDPLALRRAANAIVKILAEGEVPMPLQTVIDLAVAGYRPELFSAWKFGSQQLAADLATFFAERLHFFLKDYRGFAYDVVNAVVAAGADDVRDAIARAEALTAVRGSDDFAAICAAFKRIKNILRQAEEKKFEIGSPAAVALAPEAQSLLDSAAALAPQVAKLREARNYREALALIATLRPAVDAFFDKVMVLDPDPVVRGAHLGLIDQVLREFSTIADFSEIVTA